MWDVILKAVLLTTLNLILKSRIPFKVVNIAIVFLNRYTIDIAKRFKSWWTSKILRIFNRIKFRIWLLSIIKSLWHIIFLHQKTSLTDLKHLLISSKQQFSMSFIHFLVMLTLAIRTTLQKTRSCWKSRSDRTQSLKVYYMQVQISLTLFKDKRTDSKWNETPCSSNLMRKCAKFVKLTKKRKN